jgi:hypothetical protein
MAAAVIPVALSLLGQAPKLISAVSGVVQAVEGLFGKGQGQSKKQAAQTMLADVFNIYGTVAPAVGLKTAGASEVMAATSNLIDAVVQFYNAIGVFAHGS